MEAKKIRNELRLISPIIYTIFENWTHPSPVTRH